MEEYKYIKTDGTNPDFQLMCQKLDENLDELVGTKFQRSKYAKYNTLDTIHDVIIIYKGDDTFQIDKVSDNEFLIYHVSTGSNRKGKFKAHLHRTTRDLPYALYNVIDTHNHYAF